MHKKHGEVFQRLMAFAALQKLVQSPGGIILPTLVMCRDLPNMPMPSALQLGPGMWEVENDLVGIFTIVF